MTASEMTFGDRHKANWLTMIVVVAFHALAVTALFFTTWQAVIVALVLHWICVGWGIGMGYHRLHTHRSYAVPKPLEYFFAICGTLTLQGGPIF